MAGHLEKTEAKVRAEDERLLTRRELAEQLGVHMQTVTKWEREGLPVAERGRKGKPSLYSEIQARAWLQVREDAAQTGQTLDLARERANKERWQAALAEQTFQTRARRLLPADEVERVWGATVAAVRAKVLATYTASADRVHRAGTLEGVSGVETALKQIAHEILRELAEPGTPRKKGKTAA